MPAWVDLLALAAGRAVILDYDDDAHERYGSALRAGKIGRLMRRADVVTAGNELVPPAFELGGYPVVTRPAGAPFTIGWLGGRPSRYLDLVKPALERAVKELDAHILLIGAPPEALKGLANVQRFASSEAGTGHDLSRIDIGISPLDESASERDKSGYELLQYMALARPVVASPIGSNATLVEHRKQGILAASADEWFAAFKELAQSRELGASMGAAGRAKVQSQYTLAIVAPRLAALVRKLALRRSRRPR